MNLFLLKSAGIIALFLIIYKLFLEHDTYFKGIRRYFILGIVASIVVPFISITKYIESPKTQQIIFSQNFQNFVNTNEATPFNWSAFLFSIYIIGVALSGLYFIFQIISLFKILNTKSVKKFNNYKIIEIHRDVSPFSFFKYIVYNPNQFDATEIQQLLKHEETHVLQRHSIDMLLAHLLTCVQWFNPFAWFYKKAITQNLEYIADKEAKFTVTPKNYSYLLLKTTKPNYQMVLANNFYNSLLKKRIMMLHKNHSPRLKQFKLALILPLLVGFIFTFNTKVVAQHKHDSKSKITKINIDVFAMQFDKNATQSDLDDIKSSFKNKYGFYIKIKNLKRNKKGEITGIKITASKGDSNTQYAVKSNSPIQPIKLTYNSKSNQVNISSGATEKYFGSYYSYEYKGKGKPHKVKSLKYSFKQDKDGDKEIYFVGNNDGIHKLKGKNYVFVSDKDKGKGHTTFFTKQKGNISAIFIDDDGNKTDIIEVKKDGKKYTIFKNNSKTTWKDKDGNITKVIEVKTDKNGVITKTIEVVKTPEDIEVIDLKTDGKTVKSKMSFKIDKNGDIDASNHKKGFYFNTRDDNPPLFVIDGKVVKEGFMEKIDPESIKSISVLKGEKATKKYGKKGKNGVIEITLKKKE